MLSSRSMKRAPLALLSLGARARARARPSFFPCSRSRRARARARSTALAFCAACFTSSCAAATGALARASLAAALPVMVSHSPSDATITRPPCSGSSAARTSGVHDANGLASASPSVRDIMSPPGQSRIGPDCAAPPRAGSTHESSPPSSLMRCCSARLLSSRWSNASAAALSPAAAVSRNESESPTFACVTTRSTAGGAPAASRAGGAPAAAASASAPASAAATTKTLAVAPERASAARACASSRPNVATSARATCRLPRRAHRSRARGGEPGAALCSEDARVERGEELAQQRVAAMLAGRLAAVAVEDAEEREVDGRAAQPERGASERSPGHTQSGCETWKSSPLPVAALAWQWCRICMPPRGGILATGGTRPRAKSFRQK